MGILDGVLSSFNNTPGATPAAGTPSASIAAEVIAMLQSHGGAANGLTAMMQAFESGGLGHLFQSWVGTGQNLPVSADQLKNVLANSGILERIAQKTGMQPADVAQHLSTLLPQLIDHLTPSGQVHPGDAGSALEGLAQRFLRG